MGWASGYISKLQQGETVSFRPRGSSMKGKIESVSCAPWHRLTRKHLKLATLFYAA